MDHLSFYLDTAGEHRWRFQADNNENWASPGEGFHNLADAVANAAHSLWLAPEPLQATVDGPATFGPVIVYRRGHEGLLEAAVQVRVLTDGEQGPTP